MPRRFPDSLLFTPSDPCFTTATPTPILDVGSHTGQAALLPPRTRRVVHPGRREPAARSRLRARARSAASPWPAAATQPDDEPAPGDVAASARRTPHHLGKPQAPQAEREL